jgi:hypothetical protein
MEKKIMEEHNMNLLLDLKEILYKNNDKEHEMRIIVEPHKVKVELIYNQEEINCNDYSKQAIIHKQAIIPIVYNCSMEFAYIQDIRYRENAYEIYFDEIKLCYDIMSYLELHGKEIIEYCNMLSLDNRDFTTCDGKCGCSKCCENNTEDDLK